MFPRVRVGESSRGSYRCYLGRRGKYRFGRLRILSRFPLGLVQADVQKAQSDTLLVCPRLGRLTRAWTQLVESERAGSQRSQRQRGLVEGEFYGLRDWRPGDTRRWIHWRTSARRRTVTVRQFERQRHRDLALVVDLWQPQNATVAQLENVELAVSVAATAVADLCRRGGSRLQVSVVGRGLAEKSAAASQIFMFDVLEQLAVVTGGDATQLPKALSGALSGRASLSRTIVLSTRCLEDCRLQAAPEFRGDSPLRDAFDQAIWIDVTGDGIQEYFHWDQPS
jgi:uncharacterized protein (DUF58 family)